MTHALVIPVMNELHNTKGILGLIKSVTSKHTEFIFIDNGSTDPYEEFIQKYLRPAKVQYIKNPVNIGLVKTMQQGYEATDADVITFLHNDSFIYEQDWDKKIVKIFETRPDVGVVGMFGAAGIGANGGRIQEVAPGRAPGYSSMLEAEIHGERIKPDQSVFVSTVDGFFMSIRREMLNKCNGFDQGYQWHHFYDRDICLESLRHGYKNIVYGMNCHHWSGRTACQAEYQNQINKEYGNGKFDHTKQHVGDKATHDDNMHRFSVKWGPYLPIYINPNNGTMRTNRPYKGESIINAKR